MPPKTHQRKPLWFWLYLGTIFFSLLIPAWGKEIPLAMQIQIFIKIMMYDRAISEFKGEPFRVGFVFPETDDGKHLFQEAKTILEGKTIMGSPIVLLPLSLDPKGKVLFSQPPKIIIISPTSDEVIQPVLVFARDQKTLTFGTDPSLMIKEIAVVLTLEADKPVINLNLALAKRMGADFQANFLKLCRITK